MRRDSHPLIQKSMHLFVKAAEGYDETLVSLVALIGLFTGVRANTLCHIHSDWFTYDDGDLYLKVPNEFPCRKYGTSKPCGDCRARVGDEYSPKTPAAGGRRLKIPEQWHNHFVDRNRQQPLSLRDSVEHYFKIEEDDHGYEMFDGDGISISTANRYVKRIAAEAEIGFLRKPGYIEHSKLGRVPDVMTHDLRATYCVQLMRNDANPFKAITKTGHNDVDSLKPYIEFAEGEFDGDFEEEYI